VYQHSILLKSRCPACWQTNRCRK